MSIGQRITLLRKEINISQGQLAAAMEVSRQAVSKWENDLSAPDSMKLIRLAEFLDTDVEYLTTGRQAVPSRPPVVLTQTVEKVVEKPVVQVVEKIIEKRIEVPVIEYVDRPVYKKVYRTRYLRNPLEYLMAGVAGLILGILIGVIL